MRDRPPPSLPIPRGDPGDLFQFADLPVGELRRDPVSENWVIISTERSKRPNEFLTEKRKKKGGICPFCPGREALTPPEIAAFRDPGSSPDTPGWRLRVVPNKFPALSRTPPGGAERSGDWETTGLFPWAIGLGAHEVIVESPDHDLPFSCFDRSRLVMVLRSYKDRIAELGRDSRFRYVQIFKNHGAAAGASIEHPHTQVLALPLVPPQIQKEIDNADAYRGKTGNCLFCDILKEESGPGERLIFENEGCVVAAAFAGRFPFETWILPRGHAPRYEEISDEGLIFLAEGFQAVLGRFSALFGADFPFNLVLHTAPVTGEEFCYHWHFELYPQLSTIAGLERGSGIYINSVPPEIAARKLRETMAETRPNVVP